MDTTTLPTRLFAIISSGALDELDALLHPEFVCHGPAGRALDADGLRALVAEFRSAFPDMTVAALDVVAAGDRVGWRVDGHGTHTGPFLGVAPTGRRVRLLGVDLARVQDGRVREMWSGEDLAGVLMQIGAIPVPTPA
jgi:predicted ester cyclase